MSSSDHDRGAWPTDTRGIVDPAEMARNVDFARYPASAELQGIVDWFWSVSWRIPEGRVHDQHVLNHPSGHISIGTIDDAGVPLDPAQGRVYGVLTGLGLRRLAGDGWTVAAKTTVGGLGLLLGRPASEVVDQQLDFNSALPGIDGERVVAEVASFAGAIVAQTLQTEAMTAAVARLRQALAGLVSQKSPDDIAQAREVARVAALAEHNRSVCRTEHLAEAAGVSVRTLQRLFDVHVGVSPSWVIRRWRIIEAAEAAKGAIGDTTAEVSRPEKWPGWAQLATELGYADQSHLTRDFQRHLGLTPGEYLSRTHQG